MGESLHETMTTPTTQASGEKTRHSTRFPFIASPPSDTTFVDANESRRIEAESHTGNTLEGKKSYAASRSEKNRTTFDLDKKRSTPFQEPISLSGDKPAIIHNLEIKMSEWSVKSNGHGQHSLPGKALGNANLFWEEGSWGCHWR